MEKASEMDPESRDTQQRLRVSGDRGVVREAGLWGGRRAGRKRRGRE